MSEEEQKKKDDFFVYINSINTTRQWNAMRGTENDDLAEKGYKPFLNNRMLSNHIDCILHVNEMNVRPWTDARMQYEFFINSLRPMKRYSPKKDKESKEESEALEAVIEFYGYSRAKALVALRILTKEELANIRERTFKGGRTK